MFSTERVNICAHQREGGSNDSTRQRKIGSICFESPHSLRSSRITSRAEPSGFSCKPSMSWNQLGADRQQNNYKQWRPFLVMKAREREMTPSVSVTSLLREGSVISFVVLTWAHRLEWLKSQTHCDCRNKQAAEDDNANNNTATTYCINKMTVSYGSFQKSRKFKPQKLVCFTP